MILYNTKIQNNKISRLGKLKLTQFKKKIWNALFLRECNWNETKEAAECCWDTVMRRLKTGIRSEKCVVTRFRRCANAIECTYTNLDSTDMCRLKTGIHSEKCVVTRFRRCAHAIECNYTNLDSTDMCRLKTGIRSEKCVVRRFRRCANVRVYLHKPRRYRYASLNDGDTFWEMRH